MYVSGAVGPGQNKHLVFVGVAVWIFLRECAIVLAYPKSSAERKKEMRSKLKNEFTPLDLCILIGHETVSLLNADADALDSADRLRTGLEVFAAANELSGDVIPLLAWIDREIEGTRQFTSDGRDGPHLIEPDRLLPVPDVFAQLDTVWMLFETSTRLPASHRNTLLDTARLLTEMGGLEDMLLTTGIPAVGFLTVEELRAELKDVRTALQIQETSVQTAGQPVQR